MGRNTKEEEEEKEEDEGIGGGGRGCCSHTALGADGGQSRPRLVNHTSSSFH